MKLKDLDAELIRSILKQRGIQRANTKESDIEALKVVLSDNPVFDNLARTFDNKDNEKARIMMRFIGVVFNDQFRGTFSRLNNKTTRPDMETGSGN